VGLSPHLTLKTDARALIPGPETETVVDAVLALLEGGRETAVLDVGVGSGAIGSPSRTNGRREGDGRPTSRSLRSRRP